MRTQTQLLQTLSFNLATRALKKGMRIEYVSKLMGHSSIKTTQIYVQRLAVKKDKHSKSIRDALKK